MSSPGVGATVAVVVLALVGVTFLAVSAYEFTQPTSTSTTSFASYSSSVAPALNVTVRPNGLYSARNLTDPPVVFANITEDESFYLLFELECSPSMVGVGELTSEATVQSGTSPAWDQVVESETVPLNFNASYVSEWVPVPLNLSSVLSSVGSIDRELNVTAGSPTIVLNTSMVVFLPGGVAQNNSSMTLSFVYSPGTGGSLVVTQYSAIQIGDPGPGSASGTSSVKTTTPLPSKVLLAEEFLALSAAALVAAYLVGRTYLPRARTTALNRFLSENSENVVRVQADSRPAGKAVRVEDIGELVKLANIAGEPIFLFESPSGQGSFLYVIQGGTTFSLPFPPAGAPSGRPGPKKKAS
jgi:hypothetical protein